MWPSNESPTRGLFVKEQVESLRAIGLDVEVLHFDGRKKKSNYARLIPRLARCIFKFRPQVVHAHYGLTGFMCSLPLSAPLVVTFHGSDVYIPWQKKLSKLAAARSKANICVSSDLAESLGTNRTHVIPCGVNTENFRTLDQQEARRRLKLPADKKIVLFPASRHNPAKGYPLFSDAVNLVDGDNVHVCELFDIARDDVPSLMAAADVLVLTSLYEGYCLAVTEALACGLPVVAVPVANMHQRLAGLSNCYVVNRDPQEIAEKITSVLKSGHRIDPIPKLKGLTSQDVSHRILKLYLDIQGT